MSKRILNILLWTAGGLILLLLLIALVSQTQPFRDRLRASALGLLTHALDAEVHLGDLTGNLVTGFSIDGASVKVGRSYLMVAERVDLRYDLFRIPGRRIAVKSVRLVRPSFELRRGMDGTWNFERLVRTTPGAAVPDTVAGPFAWWVDVEDIEIEDATVFLTDSTGLDGTEGIPTRLSPFRYTKFGLSNVRLQASGAFSSRFKRLSIQELSFRTDHPGLALDRLSGDLILTDRSVAAHDLVIRTENSNIRLDASMEDVDLLAGIDGAVLGSVPVSLTLRTDDLDLRELRRLLPPVDFLDGSVDLDLALSGTFGEVEVERLRLTHGKTDLRLAGTVANLQRPEDLFLAVRVTESSVTGEDVLFLLKGLALPDLAPLGASTLNLEFEGRPLDFTAKIHLATEAGTVSSNGFRMTIGGPHTLTYAGEVNAEGLNPGRALRDPGLEGLLSFRARIDARGVTERRARGSFTLEMLPPSVLLGRSLEGTSLAIAADDTVVVARLAGTLGSADAELQLRYNPHLPVPALAVSGMVGGLNLQDFLADSSYNSDISLRIAAEGSATSWNDLNGEFNLDFAPSRFRQYTIGRETARLTIDQRDRNDKKISLRSRIADFSLVGAFNTDYVIDLIAYEVRNIAAEVGRNFAPLDSSLVTEVDRASLARLSRRLERANEVLDAEFALLAKDLKAVSLFAGTASFNGSGLLTGRIQGNYDRLALNARLGVKQFVYGTARSGFLLEGATATLTVDELHPDQPFADLFMDARVEAKRLHVNEAVFDSLAVSFVHEQQLSAYSARGVYDNRLGVRVEGTSAVTQEGLVFRIADLLVRYKDDQWRADAGAAAAFSSSRVEVSNLVMRRGEEEVHFNGRLDADGTLTGGLQALRIDLGILDELLDEESPQRSGPQFAGIADVTVQARGTLPDPRYDASVSARAVSFRSIPFGALRGGFTYEDRRVTTNLTVSTERSDTVETPDLIVTGTLPLDLAPAGQGVDAADSSMDLTIVSSGVQLNVLDPLIAVLNDFTGTMNANLRVVGSPRAPDLQGFIRLENCRFLFTPNNIVYLLDGDFEPSGSRIRVASATLRNVPEDQRGPGRGGLMRITGDFSLEDFFPGDFNLSATGQLLVVKEATVRSDLGVSGNLFVEIKEQGLRFTGEVDTSLISGSVLVRNSELFFPPTQSGGRSEARRSIPFIVVEDTVSLGLPEEESFAEAYFRALADTARTARAVKGPRRSFVDGMQYDLLVETSGANTRFTMLFDARTDEKLEATLEGVFSVQRDGRWWLGELEIQKAFYNFYAKRFDAVGRVRFIGPLLNPELDIRATYRGTRTLPADGKVENVEVTAKITGERNEPKLQWEMRIDDVDYASYSGPKSNDIQSDAITFIIANTFATTESEKNQVASNLGTAAGKSVISGAGSLLTGQVSDFLRRETGFINAVDFSYGEGGSFTESADVRISATIGDGVLTYGGRIFQDPFSNANVGILYSMGSLLDMSSLRNLMVQLEHKVDVFNQINTTDRKEVNSARLFYRFSF